MLLRSVVEDEKPDGGWDKEWAEKFLNAAELVSDTHMDIEFAVGLEIFFQLKAIRIQQKKRRRNDGTTWFSQKSSTYAQSCFEYVLGSTLS